MRALWIVALFVGLGISFSGSQQTGPSAPPKPDSQPARVKVYSVGPDVTAPELLPLNLTGMSTGNCKKKMDGKVVLSALVDETGQPRNIMFLRPLGTDLDKLALQLATADRFNPGTHDGKPVVVAQSVELNMQACLEETKNDAGKKIPWLRCGPSRNKSWELRRTHRKIPYLQQARCPSKIPTKPLPLFTASVAKSALRSLLTLLKQNSARRRSEHISEGFASSP